MSVDLCLCEVVVVTQPISSHVSSFGGPATFFAGVFVVPLALGAGLTEEVAVEVVAGLGLTVEDVCAGGFLIGVLVAAADAGPPGADLFGAAVAAAASFFGAEAVLAGGLFGGASFFGVVVAVTLVDEVVLVGLEGAVGLDEGGFCCTGCFTGVVASFLLAAGGLGVDAAVVEEVCFVTGLEGVAVVGLTCFAATWGVDDTPGLLFAAVGLLDSVVVLCPLAGPVPADCFAVAASRIGLADDGLFTVVGGGAAIPLVATDPFVEVERVDATAVDALLDSVTTVP